MYSKLSSHLAWLTIWRRKTRSIMVILMIGLSLGGLLSIQGLYDGMVTHMIKTTIRSDSGEISLYAQKYRLEKSLDHRLSPLSPIEDKLSNIEGINAYAIRLQQEGLIATAHKSRGAILKGISLDKERAFGQFDTFITKGTYSFGQGDKEALVGSGLADKLNLTLGSRVVFTAQDASGEINSISFRLSGIFKTANKSLDDNVVFISMAKMEKFLGLKESATQIALRINESEQTGKIQTSLKDSFPTMDVLRWQELYPLLIQMQDIMKTFNWVSYALVFTVATLGIFGVMLVSVLERIREFSIMLAIGTPFSVVRNQIILEALLLGLIGYMIGIVLGWVSLFYMATAGVDLRSFEAGMEMFGMNAIMYADIRPYYFIQAFFAVFLATLLSVLWPLRVLKKIKPIQIIQGKML